jgi:hypothetical protein
LIAALAGRQLSRRRTALPRPRLLSFEKNRTTAHRYYSNIPAYYAAMSDSNAPGDGAAYSSCGK